MEVFFMILCILGAIASVFGCIEYVNERKIGSAVIWGLLLILNILGAMAWASIIINKKPVNETYQYQTIVTKTLITTNDTVILESDTTYTYTE